MKKSKNLFFLIGQLGIARFVNDGARFFCAIFRQDGKLVTVQLGKGDAEMVGDLLAGLWVRNNYAVFPVRNAL